MVFRWRTAVSPVRGPLVEEEGAWPAGCRAAVDFAVVAAVGCCRGPSPPSCAPSAPAAREWTSWTDYLQEENTEGETLSSIVYSYWCSAAGWFFVGRYHGETKLYNIYRFISGRSSPLTDVTYSWSVNCTGLLLTGLLSEKTPWVLHFPWCTGIEGYLW